MRDSGNNDNVVEEDSYYSGGHPGSQGLAIKTLNPSAIAKLRSKLKNREITERRQVGDAESMMNDPPSMRPGGASEWLE